MAGKLIKKRGRQIFPWKVEKAESGESSNGLCLVEKRGEIVEKSPLKELSLSAGEPRLRQQRPQKSAIYF